ncbi:unnamed protein product [Adineta steineri]|uniref:Integrase catalytic domain-containing protein n=1 Tax=Adineta steineri TaxID=433720 RepID=A0A820AMA7_9BILA|nr:unnamed protein product [Adineta steineri]
MGRGYYFCRYYKIYKIIFIETTSPNSVGYAHHNRKNLAVLQLILKNLFYTFKPPKILQWDNGKELVAMVILNIKNSWSELLIINGRPRHPQTQGIVERSNAVAEKMLSKWQDTKKTLNWLKSARLYIHNKDVKKTLTW